MITRRLFSFTLAASAAAAGAQVALPQSIEPRWDAVVSASAAPLRNAMLSDDSSPDDRMPASNRAGVANHIVGRQALPSNQSFTSVI
jgi:hypothetical protein